MSNFSTHHDTTAKSGHTRILREEGREQSQEDLELPEWNETHYLNDAYAQTVQHWYPGAKKKSFENGSVFIFRILPGVAFDTVPTGEEQPVVLPGRNEEGLFTPGTIRQVGVIDKFGSHRKVSFIPSLPYVPEGERYEKYSSPFDNPYRLLTMCLWQSKKSGQLPEAWLPLVMNTTEISEYRKKHGLHGRFRTQLLLPLPKWRYFTYAQIYKGFNLRSEEDFEFENEPYGARPEQGLQIVSINEQVFQDLRRIYAQRARSASAGTLNEFSFPDPVDPLRGTLNYAWNREFKNPVDATAGKLEGFGYAGAVECRYHESPTKFRDVNTQLSDEFLQWYCYERLPWSHALKGTYGMEQVCLIARFFPSLRCVCEVAWKDHPQLMQAWEEAFANAPKDYDFHQVLHEIYGNEETEFSTRKPSISKAQSEDESEPSLPETEFPNEIPQTAVTRSRTRTVIDTPPRDLPVRPARNAIGPLSAVGEHFYSTTTGFDEQELDDSALFDFPNEKPNS